jgi:hypothetical protein
MSWCTDHDVDFMGAALTESKHSSRGSLSKAHFESISQPRRQSNSSLSAFQTLARGSDVELSHEPVPQTSNRPYIIATVILLLAVIAVLVFMLAL